MRIIDVSERWVIVDKPAGLLSVPGRTEADCASTRVQQRYPDARVVHRLDQATSGLLLLARGAEAQRELSAEFAQRRVGKVYEAVVAGRLAGEGLIDLPLAADWPHRPRQQVDREHGKPSQTRWRALGPAGGNRTGNSTDLWGGHTRVTLEPLTGRTHQLRVHLASLGHAILGDTLYAPPEIAAASPRLLLHATALQISGHHFHSPAEF